MFTTLSRMINRITSRFSSKKIDRTPVKPKIVIEPEQEKQVEPLDLTFYDFLKNLYHYHDGIWEDVNIFGLRDVAEMSKDVFNDWIGIAIGGKVHMFRGTCDPSVYWTKVGGANSAKDGVAHICLGFYERVYMVGVHARKNKNFAHQALLQIGNKIKIWRDGNNNFKKDNYDRTQEGYFGVNIHRASVNHIDKIGRYSAGCQVIQNKGDFEKFMSIITGSKSFKTSKRYRFNYNLMNVKEIPERYLSLYR